MKHSYLILITFFVLACAHVEQPVEQVSPIETIPSSPITTEHTDNWSYKTIKNQDDTWGYHILNNEDLYINQPYIPAVQGNQGFKSEETAAITAEFVIYKLESGFLPPSISIKELDSLKVMN